MSSEIDQLRAKNELLKKKMKELQELGCFISDETGHKCLLATENDRLRKAIKIAIPTIKEAMAEYYKARYIDLRVLVEALKGGE